MMEGRLFGMLESHALRRLHVGPIDFALRPGECVSVAGKSGAGKSVLLRMVADLDPHQGDAFLDGAACSGMAAPKWRRMVTYVAAESGWWDERVGAHFSPGTDFPTLLPAVGIPAVDTDRLRHVAFLATRALPYAYSVAGRPPPATPLRVELALPSGAHWTHGPADAADRITGPAGEYCRVFVQRLPAARARGLTAIGAGAQEALVVARAFL